MKAAPTPTSNGVPLARDLDGNAIPIPDGAAGWRVRRHTGGRPRLVLGTDKQPLRLPLDTTLADLDDMLGPGTYRLDIVDGAGNLAGVTVAATVGQPAEPSNDEEPSPSWAPQTFMPPGGTDVRLVLEANVRAMQSTFAHNQKTLETSLRVVESLRDGVRVLADAQALWIKSLADTGTLVRDGVPVGTRNAGLLPAAVTGDDEDDDDDDDGEDDEEEDERNAQAPPSWWHHIESLLPMIPGLVSKFASRNNGARNAQPTGVDDHNTDDDDEGFKVGDMLNWQHAYEKGERRRRRRAKPPGSANPSHESGNDVSTNKATAADTGDRKAEAGTVIELRRPVGLTGLFAAVPPSLMAKLVLVRKALSPDEERAAMALLSELTPDEVPAVLAGLEPMSVDDITAKLRDLVSVGSTPKASG